LFAFNRPELLRKTLETLSANDLASDSDLTIFCDGPRYEEEKALTDEVRKIAAAATGFLSLEVIHNDRNKGCAGSVIDGLAYMFATHEALVVMEDDFLCSPYMLSFLNNGLERYEREPVVFNIAAWSPPPSLFSVPAAYPYDAYFVPRFNSGGWASWRNRYEKVDWEVEDYEEFSSTPCLREAFNQGGDDLARMLDAQMEGKIDSWAIRMDYARFKHGGLGCNPVFTHTAHIGVNAGTHYSNPNAVVVDDVAKARRDMKLPVHVFTNPQIVASYRKKFQLPTKQDRFSALRNNFRLDMSKTVSGQKLS
jgi:hypothetical protein